MRLEADRILCHGTVAAMTGGVATGGGAGVLCLADDAAFCPRRHGAVVEGLVGGALLGGAVALLPTCPAPSALLRRPRTVAEGLHCLLLPAVIGCAAGATGALVIGAGEDSAWCAPRAAAKAGLVGTCCIHAGSIIIAIIVGPLAAAMTFGLLFGLVFCPSSRATRSLARALLDEPEDPEVLPPA